MEVWRFIMNEKSLDVLKQYDIDVYKTMRGRGGMLLFTNQGVKLFLECNHPDKYYEREDIITKTIAVLKKLLVLSCAISFILLTGVLKIPEKKFLAFFVSSLTSR